MRHGIYGAISRFQQRRCASLISILAFVAGNRRSLLTLAIETSCDDTAVAILEKRSQHDANTAAVSKTLSRPSALAELHYNARITARNTGHGGIHPIESLESHRANLANLVAESCRYLPLVEDARHLGAGKTMQCSDGLLRRKPDFISVTRGPGMRSNVACGLDLAKGLSVAWGVPLLGVHHMQAHALTARLVSAMQTEHNKQPEDLESKQKDTQEVTPRFPFLTLLVSGGHTMLVNSTSLTTHKILATTRDIAIGDALDKCGRLLLPPTIRESMSDTAFAKHLSKYAFPNEDSFRTWPVPKRRGDEIEKPLNKYGWQIQAPLSDTKELAFSFSGMASEVERIVAKKIRIDEDISNEERLAIARTALATAFEHLGSRTVIALEQLQSGGIDVSALVVSGGVAANDFLRFFLRELLDIRGFQSVELVFPPVDLCTDNAAMIAWCGMEMYEAGYRSELGIDALRKWSMDASSPDGGILGVGGWCFDDHKLIGSI